MSLEICSTSTVEAITYDRDEMRLLLEDILGTGIQMRDGLALWNEIDLGPHETLDVEPVSWFKVCNSCPRLGSKIQESFANG